MSEELIVRNCSPTLAGMKSASMFSYKFSSPEELTCDLRALNRKLVSKGLVFIPIRVKNDSALIYVYRPSHLARDLACSEARCILSEKGYECDNLLKCLAKLRKKLSPGGDFPHEIGLFLGYPPRDVKGFIENRAKKEKYTGTWKVYGDVKSAKQSFSKYRKCTDVYLNLLKRGKPLEHLAVSV